MSGTNDPLKRGDDRSSANQEPIRVQRIDLTDGKPGPGKRPGSGFRHHRRKAAASRHRPALIGFLGAGLLGMVLILAIIKPGLVLGLMRPPVPSATTAAQTTPSATSSPTVAIAASLTATPSTQADTAAPSATTLPPTLTTAASAATAPTTAAPAPTTTPTTAPTTKATTKATTARPTPTPVPSKTTATTNNVQIIGNGEGPSGLTPLAACCGGGPPKAPLTPQKNIQVARIADGRQQATITLDSYGYSPKILVVQTGITTTLSFDLKRADSCNDQIWYAPLDRKINLAAGERVPSFKPTEDFAFSCWMGMQGVFVKAVPDLAKADLEQIEIEVTEFLESDQACH